MRIIKGFNFHTKKLEWYLKQNELNKLFGDFFIEESDKYWYYTSEGECFYPKTNPKKIFDDAYFMCTQVVNAMHIKLNFGHNYSKVPHDLRIRRMVYFRIEPLFDEIVFSTWLTYLFLYYESHFYPENEVPFNISYYLEKIMAIDGEVFKKALFDEWKAKTDEFIEKNKALDEPYRYFFKPGLVNPQFTGSEPWDKWTEGFNTDIIDDLTVGDDFMAITILQNIREAWLKYDKENADAPKGENYADLYYFDKRERGKLDAPKKFYIEPDYEELEKNANAISQLDERGNNIEVKKEEKKEKEILYSSDLKLFFDVDRIKYEKLKEAVNSCEKPKEMAFLMLACHDLEYIKDKEHPSNFLYDLEKMGLNSKDYKANSISRAKGTLDDKSRDNNLYKKLHKILNTHSEAEQ